MKEEDMVDLKKLCQEEFCQDVQGKKRPKEN